MVSQRSKTLFREIIEISAHQYIHPTAKPTDASKNLVGNSYIGPSTGMSAVISPRQESTEDDTRPMMA